jgi:hypothetical protein
MKLYGELTVHVKKVNALPSSISGKRKPPVSRIPSSKKI